MSLNFGVMNKMRLKNEMSLRIVTVALLGAVGAICAPAVAEDGNHSGVKAGPYVTVFGGGNFVTDTDYNGSTSDGFPSGSAKLDTGVVTGAGVGYRFSPEWAAELEYAYRSNSIDSLKRGAAVLSTDGDLASVAIMANGLYFINIDRSWRPYVGGGVGFLQEIDSDLSFIEGSKVEDLEDSAFAWQLKIGIEAPLNANWRILAETNYLSSPSVSLSNSKGRYDIDYDNVGVTLGISYQF